MQGRSGTIFPVLLGKIEAAGGWGECSVTLAFRAVHRFDSLMQDADASRKALAACIDLMKPYDDCMVKHMPQHRTLYRVPEVYRDRTAE